MGPVECRPKPSALLLALALVLLLLLQVPGGYARSGIRLQRSAGGEGRAMREGSALAEEKRILLQLKATVLESNPLKLEQWPLGDWNENDQDPCAWPGVACSQTSDGGSRVTAVDISNGGYGGNLPLAFISNLSYVATVSFAGNAFRGTLEPDLVASLPSKLTGLDLSLNQLRGPLPSSLGSLPSLTKVNVSFNLFTDGIPKDLFTGSACTTSALRSLDVSSNQQLGGVLPWTLGSCPGLLHLDASNCSLSGGFPESIGRLPSLQELLLRDNGLAGPIPGSAFASCGSLINLDMSTNNLTALPAEIGNCTSLQALSVSANKLTSLPSSLGQLAELELLIASRNRIAELPQELGACTKIRVLALDHNALAGGFPAFIARLQSLQFLTLSANSLQGEVPAWIGELGLLRHLDASENSLSGSVPKEITSLRKLQFLLLASNQLGGPIPDNVGDMESLQVLDVSSNQLQGGIPASVGKLARLLWLMLANNRLDGRIPSEIGNCSSLLWLNAMNNSLSGQIPQELASIGENVNATFNLNTATLPLIPPPMGDCGAVRRWIPSHYPPFDLVTSVMTLERCRLFWNLLMRGVFMYPICPSRPPTESMGYIQLSANRFSGGIPPPIVRGSHLGLLFLDMNNLSGPIPDSGFAGALTGLNLSRNALTGTVPPALGSLTCLVSLDLSSNQLSGRIPGELQNLTQLNRFNISFNPALEGPVPSGRQFSTFGPSVYEGDPRLCSDDSATASRRSLPPCGPGNGGTAGPGLPGIHTEAGLPRVTTVVGISLACTLGLVVVVLLGFCLLGKAPVASDAAALEFMMVGGKEHHRQQYIDAAASVQVSLFSVELPKQLTYSDLVAATSNFDESNVVGSGGFGVVYKAKLPDGTTVAIKKLIQEGPQADREFLAEMETLGHLHHDNLVPLLGCSSCGGQKLLVYKYMEKGSLDDWLHERPGGREALEWPLRLNIALGIAKGLKFLHHNCSPPVVHRDMKASNILLDDNFEPRLTDFGLARVLGSGGETHVSTIVAGTLGYVPPEYCQTWRATAKGDVYSFGVVLLELATSRRPISNGLADGIGGGGNNAGGGLIDWVAHHVRKGLAAEVCDRVVTRGAAPAEVLAFLRLAVCCTAELPVRRPTMREVLRILEEIKAGNYSGVMLTHQSSKGHG